LTCGHNQKDSVSSGRVDDQPQRRKEEAFEDERTLAYLNLSLRRLCAHRVFAVFHWKNAREEKSLSRKQELKDSSRCRGVADPSQYLLRKCRAGIARRSRPRAGAVFGGQCPPYVEFHASGRGAAT
jgi:hypothetical protein